MNENELISIVIPTRNRPGPLKRALESVLQQTIENYEVIVVDDASDDDIEIVVRLFDDERILYIKHLDRRGGSEARNTGIRAAKGEYIAFLDDDDEWLENKLEIQLEKFRTNPSAGAVYSGFYIIYEEEEVLKRVRVPTVKGDIFKDLLVRNVVGTTSTVMVRKECFDSVGLFDVALEASQDADMWRRISQRFQFDYIEEPLVNYHVHAGHKISGNYSAAIRACEIEFEKFSKEYAEDRKIFSIRMFKYGKLLMAGGECRLARRAFIKSISLYPYRVEPYVFLPLTCFGILGVKTFKMITYYLKRVYRIITRKIRCANIAKKEM